MTCYLRDDRPTGSSGSLTRLQESRKYASSELESAGSSAGTVCRRQ